MVVLLKVALKFWIPIGIMCFIMVFRLYQDFRVTDPPVQNLLPIKHLAKTVTSVITIVVVKL